MEFKRPGSRTAFSPAQAGQLRQRGQPRYAPPDRCRPRRTVRLRRGIALLGLRTVIGHSRQGPVQGRAGAQFAPQGLYRPLAVSSGGSAPSPAMGQTVQAQASARTSPFICTVAVPARSMYPALLRPSSEEKNRERIDGRPSSGQGRVPYAVTVSKGWSTVNMARHRLRGRAAESP